jgi:hypothetical protein
VALSERSGSPLGGWREGSGPPGRAARDAPCAPRAAAPPPPTPPPPLLPPSARKWIDTRAGGGPDYGPGAGPIAPQTKRQLQDRWAQHTASCTVCLAAMAAAQRRAAAARFAAAALFAGLCAVLGTYGGARARARVRAPPPDWVGPPLLRQGWAGGGAAPEPQRRSRPRARAEAAERSPARRSGNSPPGPPPRPRPAPRPLLLQPPPSSAAASRRCSPRRPRSARRPRSPSRAARLSWRSGLCTSNSTTPTTTEASFVAPHHQTTTTPPPSSCLFKRGLSRACSLPPERPSAD